MTDGPSIFCQAAVTWTETQVVRDKDGYIGERTFPVNGNCGHYAAHFYLFDGREPHARCLDHDLSGGKNLLGARYSFWDKLTCDEYLVALVMES